MIGALQGYDQSSQTIRFFVHVAGGKAFQNYRGYLQSTLIEEFHKYIST